ncbi:hypothetical protein ACRE_080340 [Hapsidospora chrysogenum ATCC 11550]|uniref:Uncharacterized protein n=1 Tax=Hapsidospora chrysogenum (strain ATCC 11550 / CBS 779.69 / DSM 880 / IAM 14645 / JCM 23072 / IMI 49137) TaxID=857340 RepID=A0A086SVX1_HAPC1|nr:hypothetical protein ACRE_080340 [Hapsidospora chrysogenum ATCC 11550]
MSQPPTTPVKVPSSAASYSAATLDPDLRSQINTLLLRDGHVTRIQEALLHALNAHQSNWPTAIRSHALSLLRSGDVTSYPDLLRTVLDDVRSGTEASLAATVTANGNTTAISTTNGDPSSSSSSSSSSSAAAAATKQQQQQQQQTNGSSTTANGNSAGTTLAVPQSVIDEALAVTRESLEAVCEIDENGSV